MVSCQLWEGEYIHIHIHRHVNINIYIYVHLLWFLFCTTQAGNPQTNVGTCILESPVTKLFIAICLLPLTCDPPSTQLPSDCLRVECFPSFLGRFCKRQPKIVTKGLLAVKALGHSSTPELHTVFFDSNFKSLWLLLMEYRWHAGNRTQILVTCLKV